MSLSICNCQSFQQLQANCTNSQKYCSNRCKLTNSPLISKIWSSSKSEYRMRNGISRRWNCKLLHSVWYPTFSTDLHSTWTNGLVEIQKKLGTNVRMFLHDTPENWSAQVLFLAYAPYTKPLSYLNFSPNDLVFIRNRVFHWFFN